MLIKLSFKKTLMVEQFQGYNLKRKACCYVANAFLIRLELIWSISNLKISKIPQKVQFWQKAQGVNGFKIVQYLSIILSEGSRLDLTWTA